MSKDHSERKTYRRSPGRQYAYEHNPLRSRSEQSQSGKVDGASQGATRGDTLSKSGSLAAQRPDLRRTRQLLRQNIIATKARQGDDLEELPEIVERPLQDGYEEVEEDTTLYHRRYPTRNGKLVLPPERSPSRELAQEEETWEELGDVDPDLGYPEADPLDERLGYAGGAARPLPNQPVRTRRPVQPAPRRSVEPEDDYYDEGEYEDDEYYEEEAEGGERVRRKKKGKISRRGLLLGVVAVGGASVAAYELAPKVPGAIGTATQNIEHQLADAFARGAAKGADDMRKEFVTALEDLEGFSLNGAIAAAKLTRVAYDVFVSPIVQFGSTLTGDFLSTMVGAIKAARSSLAGVYLDNPSLIAIQKVLEAWVSQAANMPKQINAVAQTDLDGAQSYLRALQAKIAQEKALLNNPQATPTPQATPKPTPKPKN